MQLGLSLAALRGIAFPAAGRNQFFCSAAIRDNAERPSPKPPALNQMFTDHEHGEGCMIRLLVSLLLLLAPLRAFGYGLVEGAPGDLCRAAIAGAERQWHVPDRLMAAIGVVESGKRDAAGTVSPWPWTINAEGVGHWFDSKAEAIAAVRTLQARGVRSIDVGCLQVNLMHHPDAFGSQAAILNGRPI